MPVGDQRRGNEDDDGLNSPRASLHYGRAQLANDQTGCDVSTAPLRAISAYTEEHFPLQVPLECCLCTLSECWGADVLFKNDLFCFVPGESSYAVLARAAGSKKTAHQKLLSFHLITQR
jgi:hypothetical protein